MIEITQADFIAWKTSTFGHSYHILHDGFPINAVNSFYGDARFHTVRMLIFGVQNSDGYAASALAAMNETSTLPDLQTALVTANRENKVRIAQAIHKMSAEKGLSAEDHSALAKVLVSILEAHDLYFGPRIEAAIGLRDVRDKESEEALLRAIERPDDYLVKYHSCESLLARWEIQPSRIASHQSIFALIRELGENDAIKDYTGRGKEAVRLIEQLRQ